MVAAREWLKNFDPEILVLDEKYDDALVGVAEGWSERRLIHRAVYDLKKLMDILVNEVGDEEEAQEHYEFNIAGAYMGPYSPLFWSKLEEE